MKREILLLLFLFCSLGITFAQGPPIALSGTLITPDGIVPDGVVLVQGGLILAAGAHVSLPPGARTVETHGILAPGLIDLHNHLTWNVFPRWKPTSEFATRYDWQHTAIYKTLLDGPHQALSEAGLECQMERYAEVKAISEGETSVVGGMDSPCDQGLARNLDYDPELGPGLGRIVYNIYPLEMSERAVAWANAALAATPRGSLLIHIAEGAPNNASAAEEFSMLQARGLLEPGVSLIHATALTPGNFKSMADDRVGFVWSPRSNIELYGGTANVAAAKAARVTMAIAPDWSPTGSEGLLGELNYASVWNQTQPVFSDKELVTMATSNAAALAGLEDKIGSLGPNHVADLLVIRDTGKARGKDAYWSLTHAAPEDVELVMIGGLATYGDPQMMRQLSKGPDETLHVCGVEKSISFASETAPQSSFAVLEATLDRALREQGTHLAPLAECGQ